ncbi:hypothetical protein ALC53_11113 [Atta colombica]|uniref:Uncharacterized protein n=1 Tax=Atta colombica TaxID=520822 RepID=A0A195B1V7_9HYME|nr:hypothetical protein ALC53_11113 [Atta colombica]
MATGNGTPPPPIQNGESSTRRDRLSDMRVSWQLRRTTTDFRQNDRRPHFQNGVNSARWTISRRHLRHVTLEAASANIMDITSPSRRFEIDLEDRWCRVMIVLPFFMGEVPRDAGTTVDGTALSAERLINSPSDRSRRRARDEISDSTVRMTEAATVP